MKILPVAAYEFRDIARSLLASATFAIFFGVTFLASVQGETLFGDATRNVLVNAPYQIMQNLIILSIFAILVSPAFVASAILKDTDSRFDGILFSTPISRADYLVGRFLGSFAALMVAFAGAPIGMLAGALLSPAEPELFGPTNVGQYVVVYFAFALPSILILSAIIFAVASVTRNIMYSWLAAMAMWTIYAITGEIDLIPPALDPFMFQIFEAETKYWTAAERNTNLLGLNGLVLLNRLMWVGISLAIFALTFKAFSFRSPAKAKKAKRGRRSELRSRHKAERHVGMTGAPDWSQGTLYRQLLKRTRFEVVSVLTSLPFIILMGISAVLLFFFLVEDEVMYGVNAYPATRLMIQTMSGVLSGTLLGVLIFYSAEIVWRERKVRFSEIIDAVPTPNRVFVISKVLALAMILISILVMGTGLAISIQFLNGYHHFEAKLYLQRGLFYLGLPFVFLAILATFFQVLAQNRITGMILFGLYLAYVFGLARFGVEHPLLKYGLSGIGAPLSDMNGSGRFIVAGYWMRAYWASIAGLLLLLTFVLWNKGTMQPLGYRLRQLNAFKSPSFAIPACLFFAIFVGTGGYIYYNTNILNDYRTTDDNRAFQAAFERQYRQYANLPMPRTIAVKVDIDIHPYKGRVETRSTQVLMNKTDQIISTVHILFRPGIKVPMIELQGAKLSSLDDAFIRYYIFDLDAPMHPGGTRSLTFETLVDVQGFPHKGANTGLVRNGSFISNNRIAPYIGFDPDLMIRDRNQRRKYDLPPLPRRAKLEDARQRHNNADRQDSDFITFEATVSTIAPQTAVAPGHLEKEWVEGDRRYFRYKANGPMRNMYSVLSAEYVTAHDKWRDVDIAVLYHAPHGDNVGRMIEGIKDSLEYYTKAFGPYQFRQLRILEFPAYRKLAQAYPGNIPYSEDIGFIANVTEGDIDVPYYVTAHETAHQWWGHQVLPANVQGASMLAETFAQYSALMVMEQKYGPDRLRQFLKYELDKYLAGRADDPEAELPLYLVENQQYIHYHKGSLIMYALRDYLGADVVNRSLGRLVDQRAYSSTPYAISTDFLDILKEEAGPQHLSLIEDFFEKITLYDIKLRDGRSVLMDDGRYRVTLDIETRKFYADAVGNETESHFDIPVDIGLFQKNPGDDKFTTADVIMLGKHSITGTRSTIELIVDEKPAFAGIDPYNKLIDRNSDDNLGAVIDED